MIALRRGLLAAFVVGLGCSITLSEMALLLLTVLWLWRLRDPDVRRAQRWPLWQPVLAFAGATILAALASGHALCRPAGDPGRHGERGTSCNSSADRVRLRRGAGPEPTGVRLRRVVAP